VNSNQLFRWRRQLLPKALVESGAAMVPVDIAPDDGRPRRADREGVIEIAFGCGVRVRLRGEVSSETLRQVIELLR
jgi:transposase-like protein